MIWRGRGREGGRSEKKGIKGGRVREGDGRRRKRKRGRHRELGKDEEGMGEEDKKNREMYVRNETGEKREGGGE